MSSYYSAVLKYIEEHATEIKNISNLLGVRPEAIAGAIAEEYEYKDYLVYHNMFLTAVHFMTMSEIHEKISQKFYNGENGILVDLPLGKGSVKISTAICLMLEYLYSVRENNDNPLSDEIYRILSVFENDFGALCYAMMDDNNQTAIIMTALMLKKADQFYGDTLPKDSQLDFMPTTYNSMFYSNNGQTKLAWSL